MFVIWYTFVLWYTYFSLNKYRPMHTKLSTEIKGINSVQAINTNAINYWISQRSCYSSNLPHIIHYPHEIYSVQHLANIISWNRYTISSTNTRNIFQQSALCDLRYVCMCMSVCLNVVEYFFLCVQREYACICVCVCVDSCPNWQYID